MADKVDGGSSSGFGFDMFDDAVDTLEGAVSDAKQKVEDAVGEATEDIGDALDEAKEEIEDAANDAAEDIGDAAEDVWNGVGGAAKQATDELDRAVMGEVEEFLESQPAAAVFEEDSLAPALSQR